MQSFARDLRFGFRNLIKTPGFTAIVVLTLALGIGANTAIFSIVHGVLLKPLDFEKPEQLLSLWEYAPDDAGRMNKSRATSGNYFDWKAQSTVFTDMAVFGSAGFTWTGAGEPELLLGARVSASYFDVLGVEPILGRSFLPEEDAPGGNHVVILGHGLWLRRFGGARDVLGKTLKFDGQPYQVVGVLPPGVYPTWPQATGRMPFLPVYQQVFVPMALSEQRRSDRRSHLFGVLARLENGVTLERARAEMDTIAGRLEATYPDSNAGEAILVQPFMDEVVGSIRPALLVLLGAVGLVLLIACANVAGLLLARASGRTCEVAVRTALGAGRLALLQQFLAESLLLAMAGGAAGVGLAAVAIKALVRSSPEHVPRMAQSGLDLTALGFALVVSLVTSVLFGLAPAIQLSRTDINASLKKGARSTGRLAFRRLLVVVEVSIAMVLVVGAGLLLQSFRQLRQVDLGFRADNVLVAELLASFFDLCGRGADLAFLYRASRTVFGRARRPERGGRLRSPSRLQLDRLLPRRDRD